MGDHAVDQRGDELRVFLEALGNEGQCERTFFLLLGKMPREDMKGTGKGQGKARKGDDRKEQAEIKS